MDLSPNSTRKSSMREIKDVMPKKHEPKKREIKDAMPKKQEQKKRERKE
jgi:hypothetical protein